MKRFVVWTASIALALGLTNPGQEDYLEHLSWRLRDDICIQDEPVAAQQVTCVTLKIVPPDGVGGMLGLYSRRQNYLLFSIYQTDLPGLYYCGLGVGGQFFELTFLFGMAAHNCFALLIFPSVHKIDFRASEGLHTQAEAAAVE